MWAEDDLEIFQKPKTSKNYCKMSWNEPLCLASDLAEFRIPKVDHCDEAIAYSSQDDQRCLHAMLQKLFAWFGAVCFDEKLADVPLCHFLKYAVSFL